MLAYKTGFFAHVNGSRDPIVQAKKSWLKHGHSGEGSEVLMSHRGAYPAPGNTLSRSRRRGFGTTFIERTCSLRVSPLFMTTAWTATSRGKVHDQTLAMRRLDAGSWFGSEYAGEGFRLSRNSGVLQKRRRILFG